jgi:WD40 repeat protein/serine/threonine protein kinase
MPIDIQRIQGVFQAVADLPTAERAAALERECGHDVELRRRVEALLKAHDDSGELPAAEREPTSWPTRPPASGELPAVEQKPTEDYVPAVGLGQLFAGRYKLLQQIGEGGMGTVWMADQTDPVKRRVAVKLIRVERGQSKTILLRFEAERQAIALMDHPHIARLLDAGEAPAAHAGGAPTPFFVMELVKGVPLTDYCDTHKLGIPERLHLFMQVCAAVQHAHQKGIIHRDLKPSNILVESHDGKPVPKIIDFGLAKATTGLRLTEHTLFTAIGSVMGTPLYMAPEQINVNALDVDTRADIYALGIILYELLTGSTPITRATLKKAALDEMMKLIREQEVPTPSSRLSSAESAPSVAANRQTEPAKLGRLVKGELDWIVLKSLAKERDRRYETAIGFAKDIERFLNHEPVTAGPPTAGYRLRKLARKYRTPLCVAGAFLLLLVLGVIVSTWQAIRATVAEGVAQQRKREADGAKEQAEKRGDELAALNEALRQAKYIADMNLAQHAWDANNLIRTRELLDMHRSKPGQTDLRGFEWHYLNRYFHRELRTAQAYNGASLTAAFTADGKRLITAGYLEPDSEGREIRLWNAATLTRLPLELKGLTDKVGRIALSPDGRLLATGCKDKTARIWNLETSEQIALEEPEKKYETGALLSFSSDGKRLVSMRSQELRVYANKTVINIWDVAARKSIATIDELPFTFSSPVFSPDGKYVAMGLFLQGVKVWDAATGQEAFSCKYPEGKIVFQIAFSLDGKRLVVGGDDGIHIIDVATRETVAVWPSASNSRGLALSPDGHLLATGSNEGFVELWDFDSGQLLDTFRGHVGAVEHIAFSPDSNRLASVGVDGSLRMWDTNAERLALSVSENASNCLLELSSDGDTASSGIGEKVVRSWNAATGHSRTGPFEHPHLVLGIDLTPDGKRLIVADKEKNVRVWDLGKGKELLAFKINREVFPIAGYISQAGISPDGKWYALPAADGKIEIWNLETGVLNRTMKGFEQPWLCRFSPDGSRLLGSDERGTIKVWDFATGLETTSIKLNGMFIARIRFNPDGKLLAVVGHNRFGSAEARIVALESGREVTLKGHRIAVLDMAFSPDGKRVATASTDKTVGIWDLESGQEILMLKGHRQAVLSLKFSSDGRRLITASADRTIRVWDATPIAE